MDEDMNVELTDEKREELRKKHNTGGIAALTDEELDQQKKEQSIPDEHLSLYYQIQTSSSILDTEYPEPKLIIPDILPEGLTILVGASKSGKSWQALQIAVACSVGGYVFGKISVEKRQVLYLALEDSERNIQDRLNIIEAPPSENLKIATQWIPGQAGVDAIKHYLDLNPDIDLVIIDTLQRLRGISSGGSNAYAQDYEDMSKFHDLAKEKSIAILLLHHTRKMQSSDQMDRVSGTTGIAGAADTILLLTRKRHSSKASLSIMSRMVIDKEIALSFDENCGWVYNGDAVEVQQTTERQEIFDLLMNSEHPLGPTEIAEELRKKRVNISKLLQKMKEDGSIVTATYGKYLVSPTLRSHTDHNDHTSENTYPLFEVELAESVTEVNTVTQRNDTRNHYERPSVLQDTV